MHTKKNPPAYRKGKTEIYQDRQIVTPYMESKWNENKIPSVYWTNMQYFNGKYHTFL